MLIFLASYSFFPYLWFLFPFIDKCQITAPIWPFFMNDIPVDWPSHGSFEKRFDIRLTDRAAVGPVAGGQKGYFQDDLESSNIIYLYTYITQYFTVFFSLRLFRLDNLNILLPSACLESRFFHMQLNYYLFSDLLILRFGI